MTVAIIELHGIVRDVSSNKPLDAAAAPANKGIGAFIQPAEVKKLGEAGVKLRALLLKCRSLAMRADEGLSIDIHDQQRF